jgi:hypothetical protein
MNARYLPIEPLAEHMSPDDLDWHCQMWHRSLLAMTRHVSRAEHERDHDLFNDHVHRSVQIVRTGGLT